MTSFLPYPVNGTAIILMEVMSKTGPVRMAFRLSAAQLEIEQDLPDWIPMDVVSPVFPTVSRATLTGLFQEGTLWQGTWPEDPSTPSELAPPQRRIDTGGVIPPHITDRIPGHEKDQPGS